MTVSKIARWDKLKSWSELKFEIQEKLKTDDKPEEAITLDIGPQLLYTLRHPSALRCMEHTGSNLGDAFTCHYNKGAIQGVRVWLIPTNEKNGVCKNVGFETEYEITSMAYVAKHRVYLVFGTDLVLRVFTDAHSNFVEVDNLSCMTTTLCLIYNKEDDVVYAGGIGFMEEWKIHGAEHAAALVPGRKFHTDLTRNDWVRDIKIVKQNNIIIGQHGNGLCVVHTKTGKQMHRLPNRHEGPLKCCCYYRPSDFLITGGADGKIKFYNGTAFNLLHVIIGHHGPVTDLEPHSKDTLLFSSSHDGTIRIWRLDTQQIFMRLDVGEKIYHMALLGDTEFYFQTEKNVVVYSLNQFYEFFASVESETMRLLCCKGKGRPNKILSSAEDGSVRLISPVTGLTLTIIYPMPSFQVLSSFTYDLHQERLHTVLADGKVLVYNTGVNPCKGEELWTPISEDEHVNIILLITLEFSGEDGTDIDNLVFAGLENGQIILCDSVVCSLEMPLQAHEGAIVCLERCHREKDPNSTIQESHIISGGTDKFVKIWRITIVDIESRKPVVELLPLVKIYLLSIPLHVCMYSTLLWVAVKSSFYKRHKWRLLLYDMVDICETDKRTSQSPLQLTHPEDEDHSQELTSLNRCSVMNVVMTSGKDGFVKIWSSRNQLLREMNFVSPIYASCFANEHGDILVGYGTHICSVSVSTYLPLDYLKQVFENSRLDIKDDVREPPVKFDHITQPWLDITKLKQYSVDLGERRRQRLEEEIIEKLKKSFEKETTHKFVIFVDGNTTKVIRKDFADKLLTWAKGKIKLKVTKPAEFNPFSEIGENSRKKSEAQAIENTKDNNNDLHQQGRDYSSLIESNTYLDKQGLIQVYPSCVGKALRELECQRKIGPIEMKLLQQKELMKSDPIIAPDGFIPNSVIRGRIKPKKYVHEIPVKKEEKAFKLKPVPKVNPHHMPSWWGKEEDIETTTVSDWDEISPEAESRRSQYKGYQMLDFGPSDTNLSETSGPSKVTPKFKPVTPTMYKLKSKRLEMNRVDLEMGTPDSMRRGRRSEARGREKSFKLTNYAVDEDSSAIRPKEKSGRKRGQGIIKQLLEESWMPDMDSDCDNDEVFRKLISVLDNDNPAIYDSVCNYLTDIFSELGLSDAHLDDALGKLGNNLKHPNTAIRKYSIKTMQVLGQGRPDILPLILPKLVDPEEPIRQCAAKAVQLLTGATSKEALMNILEELGITSGYYSSKEDEELALAMLAERFTEPEDPQLFDRIQNWVEGTTPGLFEDDKDDDFPPSWSRKETSFMSDGGKSGKKDSPVTPRSRGTGFKKKLPDIDGFSTVSERSSLSRKSRGSGRFTPRDPKLYKYYDNLHQDDSTRKHTYKESDEEMVQKDSDYRTMSDVTNSQINDRLSGYDSGITNDLSEYSHGGRTYGKEHGVPLSPLKSVPTSPSPKSPQDWRKFFDMVPNAHERRQMEQIRKEMEEGKLRHSTLPPITYFAEDLPMLPGEAGTRLLQTVRVGEKMQLPGDGRHRIESVPGKLQVHTQNEDAGLSNFGILQMQWTTGVPTVRDRLQPPQRIPQHRTQRMIRSEDSSLHRRQQMISEDEELRLPCIGSTTATITPSMSQLSGRTTNHYEWEYPLPPPPAKESRTSIPHIRKDHDNYCKYYNLIKKKLHLYTSQQREKTRALPEVFVKRLREPDVPRSHLTQSNDRINRKRTLTKTDMRSSLTFPPIKLGQLVKIF